MSVADERGRRADAAAGLVFVVLALVGFLLPGAPPKADDSIGDIRAFFTDHRDALLAGNLIVGLAAAVFLWFLGSLRSYLRAGEGGEGRLSAAAFAAGVAAVTLLLGGVAVFSGLAFEAAADLDGAGLRAAFDVGNAFFTLSALPFAALFAAAACSGARSGALPAWAYWSGSAVALIQVVSAVALFAKSGFFSVGNAFAFIAVLAALLWLGAISATIVRRGGVPPVPRTEP